MSSRDFATFLVATIGACLLIAAIPGSSITSAGAPSSTCGAPQTLFSAQTCNVPTLAAGSDEFDSASSASNWTVVSNNGVANVSSSAFLPYSFAGTQNLYSFSGYRPGWLMTQPKGGAVAGVRQRLGFYRDITPTTDMTVYAQAAMLSLIGAAPGEGEIRLMLTDSSTTAIGSLVGAGCTYSYRGQEIIAFTDSATAPVTYNNGSVSLFPRYDNLYLHRSGTNIWCWAGTDDGLNTYFTTITKSLTYTRLWVIFLSGTDSSGGGPGYPVIGLNYVRVVSDKRFLP